MGYGFGMNERERENRRRLLQRKSIRNKMCKEEEMTRRCMKGGGQGDGRWIGRGSEMASQEGVRSGGGGAGRADQLGPGAAGRTKR